MVLSLSNDNFFDISHIETLTSARSLDFISDPPSPDTPLFVDKPVIEELYTGRVTTQFQGGQPQKFVTYLPTDNGRGYDYKQRFGVEGQNIAATLTPASFRVNTNGITSVDTGHVSLVSELLPGVPGALWFLRMAFTLTAQAAVLVNIAYRVTLIRDALSATAGSPTTLNSLLPELRILPDSPTTTTT